jgi:hypothetical protein
MIITCKPVIGIFSDENSTFNGPDDLITSSAVDIYLQEDLF